MNVPDPQSGIALDRESILTAVHARVSQEEAIHGAGGHGKGETSVFARLNLADFEARQLLADDLPPLAWTFTDFMLTQNVGLLVGPPGTGKSFFALLLASAVACGRGCEGILEAGVRGRVLVLAGEEDARIIPRRLRRLRDHLLPDGYGRDSNADSDEADFLENLIVVPLAGQRLRLLDKDGPGAPATTNVFDDLVSLCRGKNLQLVVIDPQSRFYGLDENDNSASTVYIEILERLAAETGASILCLHHVNKTAMVKKDGFRVALGQGAARGASGFTGAVRAQMNLVTLTAEEARRELDLTGPIEEGEYLALAFPKCSYGPPRPVVFLKRLPGGVLVAVEAPERVEQKEAEAAILEWIVTKVREHAEQGKEALTIRDLGRFSSEWKDIPGTSRQRVEDAARVAVLDGSLFTVTRANKSGRKTEYLSLSPDVPEAPREAPSFEAPEAPRSAQNARAVLIPNDSGILRSAQEKKRPDEFQPSKTRINRDVPEAPEAPLLKKERAGALGAASPLLSGGLPQ
ncbi:RecA-family ATPase-like protein [Solidesulfovibrio fructosivorans JJ]]|uniref:RecA-family ATPase-like protein n=1 Tax=Solidesulfovibrio fructosivorans JJ] TaxID=596151 RepID=E1JUS0_SOLFR|nr:AAA family ATPase [Solidesulfovibrio fructosivorans]EFL51834.1 RecA-family ATPase-like protein [Solidesulfovibrio fructosivorans JJ]]